MQMQGSVQNNRAYDKPYSDLNCKFKSRKESAMVVKNSYSNTKDEHEPFYDLKCMIKSSINQRRNSTFYNGLNKQGEYYNSRDAAQRKNLSSNTIKPNATVNEWGKQSKAQTKLTPLVVKSQLANKSHNNFVPSRVVMSPVQKQNNKLQNTAAQMMVHKGASTNAQTTQSDFFKTQNEYFNNRSPKQTTIIGAHDNQIDLRRSEKTFQIMQDNKSSSDAFKNVDNSGSKFQKNSKVQPYKVPDDKQDRFKVDEKRQDIITGEELTRKVIKSNKKGYYITDFYQQTHGNHYHEFYKKGVEKQPLIYGHNFGQFNSIASKMPQTSNILRPVAYKSVSRLGSTTSSFKPQMTSGIFTQRNSIANKKASPQPMMLSSRRSKPY